MIVQCKAPYVLATLHRVMKFYGNLYCYPAQLTILRLLKEHHNVKISIATLNRWLGVLGDEKYILRRTRFKYDPKLGWMFKSTLYWLTIKGYVLLGQLGVFVADMIARIKREDAKRKAEPRSGSGKDVRLGEMAPLKDIMGRVLKCPVIAGH